MSMWSASHSGHCTPAASSQLRDVVAVRQYCQIVTHQIAFGQPRTMCAKNLADMGWDCLKTIRDRRRTESDIMTVTERWLGSSLQCP